jgi:mono/diheme cytochrome c family protein
MRIDSLLRIIVPAAFAPLFMACTQDPIQTQISGNLPQGNRVTDFRPGPPSPLGQTANRLEETDTVIADGKFLFQNFNCSGCHAAGGGAIGPALTDDEWTYGNSAGNIFWTIMEGRPQGMPAFGGRIAEDQAWTLAAYVRSLSQLTEEPSAASPALVAQQPSAPETSAGRGRQVFLQGPCPLCHTVRGTPALATVGPDLTHIASRTTIAGFLPNTRGNMAGWILNPQNIEPGTQMPPSHLAPEDLHALLDYLATLQ